MFGEKLVVSSLFYFIDMGECFHTLKMLLIIWHSIQITVILVLLLYLFSWQSFICSWPRYGMKCVQSQSLWWHKMEPPPQHALLLLAHQITTTMLESKFDSISERQHFCSLKPSFGRVLFLFKPWLRRHIESQSLRLSYQFFFLDQVNYCYKPLKD